MFGKIDKAIGVLASILLFVLMLLTFFDVVGRNLFNHPLEGASETTEILLAVIIFLMLPHVALKNQHIVIDLIDNVANRVVQIFLDVFAAVVSALMFGLIAWQVWILGNKAMGYADATPTLQIPIGPVLYGIAILSAINSIAFLLTIPEALQAKPHEHNSEDAPSII